MDFLELIVYRGQMEEGNNTAEDNAETSFPPPKIYHFWRIYRSGSIYFEKLTTEIHFSDVPPLWLHNMSKIQE